MLRVDHAGECAAVRIYEGQRAVLGHTAEGPLLAEMAEHERVHLERFQRMVRVRACTAARAGAAAHALTAYAPRRPTLWPQLPQYRARPSALLPLWSGAAYALGACSGLLGREAAYAVTEAVEDVITAHYNDQLRELATDDLASEAELRAVFRAFRDDEQAHLEAAVARDAHQAPFYSALSLVVKTGCRGAIWLCKRV
jgi:ubiquinone biosynthesis monooxygenase Coq7